MKRTTSLPCCVVCGHMTDIHLDIVCLHKLPHSLKRALLTLPSDVQAMNCERVALAVNHECTLAHLDKVLRENVSLQGTMLSQAQQVWFSTVHIFALCLLLQMPSFVQQLSDNSLSGECCM